MIEGVRMRLWLTVWNSTVDTAMAWATRTMDRIFMPRNGRMKSHRPLAFSVMNSTITAAAMAARIRSTRIGRRSLLRKALAPLEQKNQEEGAADDSHDGADGNLVGVIHHAADHVAGQHEAGAHYGDPGQGAAHV